MDYFRLVGVIVSTLVLLVDEPLARPVKCGGYGTAPVAAADDLGGEMIDRHFSPGFPSSASPWRGNSGFVC
jgi:hypothetical protein